MVVEESTKVVIPAGVGLWILAISGVLVWNWALVAAAEEVSLLVYDTKF